MTAKIIPFPLSRRFDIDFPGDPWATPADDAHDPWATPPDPPQLLNTPEDNCSGCQHRRSCPCAACIQHRLDTWGPDDIYDPERTTSA